MQPAQPQALFENQTCKSMEERGLKASRVFGMLGIHSYPIASHYSRTRTPEINRE